MQDFYSDPEDSLFLLEGEEREDFPTTEELLEALELILEPARLRSLPVGLQRVSQELAKHWQEIENPSETEGSTPKKLHDLETLTDGSFSNEPLPLDPDFLIAFAKFLLSRIGERLQEVQKAQYQLTTETRQLAAFLTQTRNGFSEYL